jgi:hypothetical protein
MATPRELLGTIACFNPDCGVDVPVKQSAGGAVAVCCPYCDLQAYGRAGTQARENILRMMKPKTGEGSPMATSPMQPEPAAARNEEQAVPVAKPVPKKRTLFG